jgi:hypothetical protein
MKKYVLLFVLFIGATVFAQQDLNSYQCVVVPSKFDFQKQENQYGLSDLLKFKFNELGFETYIESEDLPNKYVENPCLVLTPVIIKKRKLFKTIMHVEVRNCYGKVLFVTKEGSSGEKINKVASNIAVRESLKSFGNYKLVYTPVNEDVVVELEEKLVKSEPVKQTINSNFSEDKLAIYNFIYKDQKYKLVKKSFMLFEIQKLNTNEVVGSMVASGLKKGVFHIKINEKIGFCYYGENENIIAEFMSSNNSVEMVFLQRID